MLLTVKSLNWLVQCETDITLM